MNEKEKGRERKRETRGLFTYPRDRDLELDVTDTRASHDEAHSLPQAKYLDINCRAGRKSPQPLRTKVKVRQACRGVKIHLNELRWWRMRR